MEMRLLHDAAFKKGASSPETWKEIQRDVEALILNLGLTRNYAMPFHSGAQRRIMTAFGQPEITCNGEALDVALSAAEYASIAENQGAVSAIPTMLTSYGQFLSDRTQVQNSADYTGIFNQISNLVDSSTDGRIRKRMFEKSLPVYFNQAVNGFRDGYIAGFRAKRRDVIEHPETFAETYRDALFETAIQVIFTRGTGANYATAPTRVFSREATVRNGKVVLLDNSDIITESQAVSRAGTLCDILVNSNQFELRGTEKNPNLPYDIAAIRLALNDASQMYAITHENHAGYKDLGVPHPAISSLSQI
jgi:hypothetical protein